MELTHEELIEVEDKFIRTCHKICMMYDSFCDGCRMSNLKYDPIQLYSIARIFYDKRIMFLRKKEQYRIKESSITFYGAPHTGGKLMLSFLVDDSPEIKFQVNQFLPYPPEGEIMKIIINKYSLKSKEDLDSFIKAINDKDIELI